MKNRVQVLFMFMFFSALSFRSFGSESLTPKWQETTYNHLVEINSEWKKYADFAPQIQINFESDADRISLHLKLVIQHLHTHIPEGLSETQYKNRINLLNALNHYANEKTFPINTEYTHRQPCFVDEKETHCAVGYMMAVSGNDNLVSRIRSAYNYDYLQDIKTSGVTEWAEEFGFTIAELKWIQPTYPPSDQYTPIGEGANGEIKIMERMTGFGDFLVAGKFTELNGLPCLNIGFYNSEHLSCLGDGIAGIINGVYSTGGNHFVFGKLEHEGVIYPMASFTDGIWTYYSIPTREGATATAGYRGPYPETQIQLAISHPDLSVQEIWFMTTSGEWSKKAAVTGVIYDIEVFNYDFAYAGHFSSVITYIDGDFDFDLANNLLIYNDEDNEWTGINQPTSDTIKCLTSFGSALYMGGSASAHTESNICLSRYYLGVVSPLGLLSNFQSPTYASINDITLSEDAELYLAGDFKLIPELGTWGQYLATYNITFNQFEAIAHVNKSISTVYRMGSEIFIGGKFTTNRSGVVLNHIAQQNGLVSTPEYSKASSIEAFPNPFIDRIQLKGDVELKSYILYNQTGQIVHEGIVENQTIQALSDLPKGMYVLALKNDEKEWRIKLVK